MSELTRVLEATSRGERLVAIHPEGAFVLDSPFLDKPRFDWLEERASAEPPLISVGIRTTINPKRLAAASTNEQRVSACSIQSEGQRCLRIEG